MQSQGFSYSPHATRTRSSSPTFWLIEICEIVLLQGRNPESARGR